MDTWAKCAEDRTTVVNPHRQESVDVLELARRPVELLQEEKGK